MLRKKAEWSKRYPFDTNRNNNSIFKSNETFFASIIKQDGRSISKYDTLLLKSVETLYDKFSYFFFKYVLQEKKDQVEISSTSNLPSNKKGERKNILKLLWTGV